jgi:hypothetical protein
VSSNPKYMEIREVVKSEVELSNQTAVSEITRLPASINGMHCRVTATGLVLDENITYKEFARLMWYMDGLTLAHSVRECLFKFYIGDALNHGERILGEDYSQIFDKLHWTQRYISNIQWVARKIPDENRDVRINNWKFWTIIAPFSHEDQKFWVAQAKDTLKMDNEWLLEIKKRIGAWKLQQELDRIEDPELKEEIREVAEHNEGVSWSNVHKWIDDGKVPEKHKTSAQWWTDELDALGIDGETREGVFDAAMRFVTEIYARRIKSDGKARLWLS